jgi:hypothetical protein
VLYDLFTGYYAQTDKMFEISFYRLKIYEAAGKPNAKHKSSGMIGCRPSLES